jgi:hypothetical protein
MNIYTNYETYLCLYNMCKFRCGSHKLPIEMGRFCSIDRSERICDLCNSNCKAILTLASITWIQTWLF